MPDPVTMISVAKYLFRSYVDTENPVLQRLDVWLQHTLDQAMHMYIRNNWC